MCGGLSAASGNNGDGNTTVVRDSNGETVITQSGNPAQTEVHIDRKPGRTTIYRHSGGNTAVVVQSSRGALPGQILDWLKKRSGP
jgi:hypothetical protein